MKFVTGDPATFGLTFMCDLVGLVPSGLCLMVVIQFKSDFALFIIGVFCFGILFHLSLNFVSF